MNKAFSTVTGILLAVSLTQVSCKARFRTNDHLILKNWKFRIGDTSAFADAGYDDNNWGAAHPADTDEFQKYTDENEFVWYRIAFRLPSTLIANSYRKDSLEIFLGKIGEYDQVFINGNLIGQNNSLLPANASANDTFPNAPPLNNINRSYKLSVSDNRISWDTLNSIAVRVFDRKGKGAFICGAPYIAVTGLESIIRYNKGSFYKPGNLDIVDTILRVINISKNDSIKGVLTIHATQVTDHRNRDVYSFRGKISLTPGSDLSLPISLPITTEITTIHIAVEDNISGYAAKDSIKIPFILARQIDN